MDRLRDGGLRVLVGDAQGKGLAALDMAGSVLGACRRAAWPHRALDVLADELDETLRQDMREYAAVHAQSNGGRYAHLEGFVTAVALDMPRDDVGEVRMINLGHPPPLLIHR